MLLVTPLLQELKNDFPNASVDIFAKGALVEVVFENYPNFGTSIRLSRKPARDLAGYVRAWSRIIFSTYDLIINVDAASKSGTLATRYAKSDHKVFGIEELPKIQVFPDYRHLAKYPVYAYWSHFQIPPREIAPLRLVLSEEEEAKGREIYSQLKGSSKPLIFLFTYATNQKMYDSSWWQPFYDALSLEFSDEYEFVEVLPAENISQFNHQIKHYYSRDVREIASVLQNGALFIGADSGIMHLAAASGVRTIGLFKVTQPDKYEPYGNGSGYVDTTKSSLPEMVSEIRLTLNKKQHVDVSV